MKKTLSFFDELFFSIEMNVSAVSLFDGFDRESQSAFVDI